MNHKKTIVYLHRYPIEYESIIYPATERILKLLKKKYNVVWVSMKNPGKIDQKLRKGISFVELPWTVDRKNGKDKLIKTALWFLSAFKIRKIIKESKADFIVHKEQLPFLPYFFSSMEIPLLLDIGDWWWTTLFGGTKIGSKFAEVMENFEMRLYGRKNNVFMSAHSLTEAKVLEERGMNGKRVRFINHPASQTHFKPVDAQKLRKKLGLENSFVVSMHGIIHPSKGYDQILTWWADISKDKKDWKLMIIGGGTGEKWCRNKIKSLGIENSTIMTGWIK
ncbi:MAG TPA: glycosyltransferase, partial [Candidatus Nanoarchaeia archaeon]|nr:glycosyltransferase [Candidatus Nanoarchaeia archaeon]